MKYLLVVLALQLRVRISCVFPTAWQNLLLFNHFTPCLWLCPHSSHPGRCFRTDSPPCHLQGTGQGNSFPSCSLCWRKVMFGKDPGATGRKNIVVISAKRDNRSISAPAVQGGREIISFERCGMMRSSEVLHCGVWTCKMWRLNNLLPCSVQAT